MALQPVISVILCIAHNSPLFSVYNSPNKLNQLIPKKITVAHIAKIVNEVYGSGATGATPGQTIPLQQKLTICTLLLLMKRNKLKEATLGKVSCNFINRSQMVTFKYIILIMVWPFTGSNLHSAVKILFLPTTIMIWNSLSF